MTTNSELYQKILDASNIIHQQSLKGAANYIIIDSVSAELINNYENHRKIKEDRKKKLKHLDKLSNNTYEIPKQIEDRKKESEKIESKNHKF